MVESCTQLSFIYIIQDLQYAIFTYLASVGSFIIFLTRSASISILNKLILALAFSLYACGINRVAVLIAYTF